MSRFKNISVNENFYSKESRDVFVAFVKQQGDTADYEDIANQLIKLMPVELSEDPTARDVISRLQNCPEYFKDVLERSLYIYRYGANSVKGIGINSFEKNKEVIVSYYDREVIRIAKHLNVSKAYTNLIIVALILGFGFYLIHKDDSEPIVQPIPPVLEDTTKLQETAIASDVVSTATVSDSSSYNTAYPKKGVKEVSNGEVSSLTKENINETNKPTTESELNRKFDRYKELGDKAYHNYKRTGNETDLEYGIENYKSALRIRKDSQITSRLKELNRLSDFERYKKLGDATYKSYYNGPTESSLRNAIRNYEHALEIQYDSSIEKKLNILKKYNTER